MSYLLRKINVNIYSQNTQILFSQFFVRLANGYMANTNGNPEEGETPFGIVVCRTVMMPQSWNMMIEVWLIEATLLKKCHCHIDDATLAQPKQD